MQKKSKLRTRNITLKILLPLLFIAHISVANHYTEAEDTIVPGRMLSFKDSVFLEVKDAKRINLLHVMKPGQNLKGLEKYYSLSLGDLIFYNPHIYNIHAIPVGYPVKIPLPMSMLLRQNTEKTAVRWRVIPLFYRVKQGETLFRIAKVYFDMPVEVLKARNGLIDNTLENGQILHIGWMDVRGIPPTARKYSGLIGELRVINDNLKAKYNADATSGKKEHKEKGIGMWQKNTKRDTKLYALHKDAPIGTVIKVYAPSSKRYLYVKVLGRMSDNVYRDNVILFLSPSAARALGAVNSELRVELTYYQ